jgi:hypothetical protein
MGRVRSKALFIGFLVLGLLWASSATAAQRTLAVVVDGLIEQLEARFKSSAGQVVEAPETGTLVVKFPKARAPEPDEELFLYRAGKEIINRLTGERLGRLEQVIGLVKILDVQGGVARARVLQIKPGSRPEAGDLVKYPQRIDVVLEQPKFLGPTPAGSEQVADMLSLSIERSRLFRATVMGKARAGEVKVWHERRYSALLQPIVSTDEAGPRVDLRLVSRYTGEVLAVIGDNFSPLAPSVAQAPEQAPVAGPQLERLRQLEARLKALEEAQKKAAQPTINPDIQQVAPIGEITPEEMQRFRASQDLSKEAHLLNIALGDIDGDGRGELVGMGDNFLKFYRWNGLRFEEFHTIKASSRSHFLRLDVANINGIGPDEIFVTHLKTSQGVLTVDNKLESFVLEYRGGRFVKIWSKQPYFLRVLKSPQLGRGILLAQKMGHYRMYGGPVMQLRWTGTTYEQEPDSIIPPQFNIYGFMVADLKNAGSPEFFVIQDSGRLAAFNQNIEKTWMSEEVVGGFNHVSFKQLPRNPSHEKYIRKDASPDELMVTRYLKGRMEVVYLGGPEDGHYGLLVGSNYEPFLSKHLLNTAILKNGRVVHYAWNGIRYVKEWETRPMEQHYLADFALGDLEGDGLKELVLLLHTTTYVKNPTSRLELYRLGTR